MKVGKMFCVVYVALLLTLLLVCFVGIIVSVTDGLTAEEIGIEMVPCIDEKNRPFENELCEKTLYCSYLGFSAERRCSDVRNLNQSRGEGE